MKCLCSRTVLLLAGLLLLVAMITGPWAMAQQPVFANPHDQLPVKKKPRLVEGDAHKPIERLVGLLPVDFAPLPGTSEAAGELELQLQNALQEHLGESLIDAETMGRWFHKVRGSRIDRRDLQAGELAGASLLVLPRLVHRGGAYLTHLQLIDTATGKTLWQQTRQDADQHPIGVLLDQLLHQIDNTPGLVADETIDIALLLPYDVQEQSKRRKYDWRAQATWDRWANKLAQADPRFRLIDPRLGDFVSRSDINQRTGLSNDQRPAAVVNTPIIIETRLDAPYTSRFAFEDAPYQLTMTIRDGDWQKQIESKGTFENASAIEAELLNQALSLIAKRRGVDIKTPIKPGGDEAYWQARALMYEAQTSPALEFDGLYNKLKTADGKDLITKVVAAAKALPGSNEPFAPLGEVMDDSGVYTMHMSGGQPFDELRQLLLKHYTDSFLSKRTVSVELNKIYDRRNVKLKDDNPKVLAQVLKLAQQSANNALLGRSVVHQQLLPLLLHVGEGQLALDAATALAWKSQSLMDWQPLASVVCEAIDLDDMALAYRAYETLATLYPGYYREGQLRQKNRLEKIRQDEEHGRAWSDLAPGLLEGVKDLGQKQKDEQKKSADYFEALSDQERWQQIHDEALAYLRENDPPTNGLQYTWNAPNAYLRSLNHLMDDQAYEKRLLEIIYGDLPEIKGGWRSSVVMRQNAWRLRSTAAEFLAWHWMSQRRFEDILNHPMLGTKAWYHGTHNDEWELYLYAGQPQRAIEFVEYKYDRTSAYLYAGRFEEALQFPLDDRHHNGLDYAKAAMLANDLPAFNRALAYMKKKSDEPLPRVIQYFQLLRQDAEALEAWTKGYAADFMRDTDAAIKAYQECAIQHPNTFVAAEAMFRTGELLLLDKRIEDKAQFWFSESAINYEKIINQYRNKGIQTWCRYRIGQVAHLTQNDSASAKQAWQLGAKGGEGPGKTLCSWALHSLEQADPIARVGDTDAPAAGRLVDIDLNAANVHVVLDQEYPTNKIDSHIFGPIGLEYELFEGWSDDQEDKWWMVYLWYMYADIRPGFTLVYTKTPNSTEAVWCRMQYQED